MSRFIPDSELIGSYVHAVYRYKTNEVDDQGEPIYRPIVFQNDLEDITCTYGNFELTEFDPAVPEQCSRAYTNAITKHDINIQADIVAGTLDLFKLVQHMEDFIHVGSKLFPARSEIPTRLSQLNNDAGYIKNTETIQNAAHAENADQATKDSEGNTINIIYAKKSEVWDEAGHIKSNIGSWSIWVTDN